MKKEEKKEYKKRGPKPEINLEVVEYIKKRGYKYSEIARFLNIRYLSLIQAVYRENKRKKKIARELLEKG